MTFLIGFGLGSAVGFLTYFFAFDSHDCGDDLDEDLLDE